MSAKLSLIAEPGFTLVPRARFTPASSKARPSAYRGWRRNQVEVGTTTAETPAFASAAIPAGEACSR